MRFARCDSAAAVQLFVQRAQMVKPDFELNDANSAAVETIVDHLDGLPLAIELAAPRLLLLPPKALAARLERRLPLLGDGATDRPERQQTMHGAIAWSYDLLSDSEQRLFRRLGVLQGGGTLEAAAAVAGDGRDERSILFRLAPLVEKNMLWLAEDADAEPRVSMLEMLREFAHERLVESGELDDAQRRHAEYVLQFTAGAERQLTSSAQGRRLAHLERDHANIHAALEWVACSARDRDRLPALERTVAILVAARPSHRGPRLDSAVFSVTKGASRPGPGRLVRQGAARLRGAAFGAGKFRRSVGSRASRRSRCSARLGDDAGLGASLTSLGIILPVSRRVRSRGRRARRKPRDPAADR